MSTPHSTPSGTRAEASLQPSGGRDQEPAVATGRIENAQVAGVGTASQDRLQHDVEDVLDEEGRRVPRAESFAGQRVDWPTVGLGGCDPAGTRA